MAIRPDVLTEGKLTSNGKSLPAARKRKTAPEGAEGAPNQTVRAVRQIPRGMWDSARDDLEEYLHNEIMLADSERTDFIRKLARWKVVYRAPTAEEPKHFPIWNASNLTVPLIKEIVNTIAAQIAQSTTTARPQWVLKDLAAEWKPFTTPVERFLDIASKRDLGLKKMAIPYIIEAVKYGTSVCEVGHSVDTRRVYKYTPDGKDVYPSTIVHQDGPRPVHFPLQDFFVRWGETDHQDARWCSRRLWLNEKQIRDAVAGRKFENVDKLHGHSRRSRDLVTDVDEKIEKTRSLRRDLWEVHKVWISWDVDGEGNDEELLLYYCPDARTFLSKKFMPYWHGKRPIVKLGYFPVEHRFYDEGLCEMLEDLQIGISDKHNKRADNETLANAAMIIKRKMSKGIMPGDPLYAAKVIETADIWNDIREFRLSEPYQSTVQEEQILRQYADNLAGMSDAQRGSAMPVSRTTASAQLALLQEQARKIDISVQAARAALDEIGEFTVHLYYQFGTNGKAIEWLGEHGRIVEALFRLPRRVTEIGQALRVSTPTSLQNRQVKRENAIALFNLLVQMYQQILPLAQALAPEQLPEVAHALVRSAQNFMGETLDTFEVTNPEDVLAGLTVLERVLPSPEDLGGLESFRRSAENEQIIERLGKIEDLFQEAQSLRDNPRGAVDRRASRREGPRPYEGPFGGPRNVGERR